MNRLTNTICCCATTTMAVTKTVVAVCVCVVASSATAAPTADSCHDDSCCTTTSSCCTNEHSAHTNHASISCVCVPVDRKMPLPGRQKLLRFTHEQARSLTAHPSVLPAISTSRSIALAHSPRNETGLEHVSLLRKLSMLQRWLN